MSWAYQPLLPSSATLLSGTTAGSLFKAGTITSPTTTGSASFTGVGFRPKVILLFFEKQTATGSGVDYLHGAGFAYSNTNRRAVSSVYLDGVAGGTINMARAQSNEHVLYAYNTTAGSTSAFLVADLISFDVDGFTLDFNTVQGSGYLIGYVALGGDNLTNVAIKDVQAPAAPGSQAYTGVGFQSDAIITISNSDTSAGPGSSHNAGARIMMGFGTSTDSKTIATLGDDVVTVKKHAKVQKTDIAIGIDGTVPSVLFEATLTSLDSDGFTWNWSTTSLNRYVFVLCLKGGNYKVGTFNQATSTGNQSITGAGMQPSGVILTSANAASSTSIATNNDFSIGAASSSSSRFGMWLGSSGDPTVVDHYYDQSNVLQMYTEGTPTQVTTADYVSNDSDGFTINNTTVDGTSREVVYFAFGTAPAGATEDTYPYFDGGYYPTQ